jgi:hypothetical protein
MPNKPVKKTNQRMTNEAAKKKAATASKATTSLYDKIITKAKKEGRVAPAGVSTRNSRQMTSKEAKASAPKQMKRLTNALDKPKNKNLNFRTVAMANNAGRVLGWAKNPNSKAGRANTKYKK